MPGMLAALTYLRGSARWRRSTPCAETSITAPWSAKLPVTQRIEIDGFRIYVLHILAELDPQAADNVDAVRAASAYPSRSAA